MDQAEPRTLVPVTAKMLIDGSMFCERAMDLFNGSTTVRLVGRVLDLRTYELNSKFVLDDGTGTVAVDYWYPIPGTRPIGMGDVSNGCYADVVGKPVRHRGPLNVQAFSTRKIVDFNEVTLHFISAIHSSIVRGVANVRSQNASPSKGMVVYDKALGGSNQEEIGQQVSVSVDTKCTGPADSATQLDDVIGGIDAVITSSDVAVTQEDSDMTKIRCSVLGAIVKNQNDGGMLGVGVSTIVDDLGIEEQRVRDAIKELHDVGEIYETVDGEHYAAT